MHRADKLTTFMYRLSGHLETSNSWNPQGLSRPVMGLLLLLLLDVTWKPEQLSRYDSLRVGRSGDRIQGGERFSTPVQTGSGDHPASYTMGTGSFQGVMRPGRDVDHAPTSRAGVKGTVELYLYAPCGPSWPFIGRTLHFNF